MLKYELCSKSERLGKGNSMANSMKRYIYPIGMILCLHCQLATAENWSQFRGSNLDGVSSTQCPVRWHAGSDDSQNVRWKVALDGEGWSSPIIWGDSVFLTAAVPVSDTQDSAKPANYEGGGGSRRDDLTNTVYRYEVICLDAQTGEIRWRTTACQQRPPMPRHSSNTYATETPITDGDRIYAYFGMTGIYCFDMQGKLQWKNDLGSFKMRAGWGTSSSPVLLEDKIFVQVDNEEQSFLVALDTKTGDEIWRVNRDEKSQYSAPIIWKNSLRTELIAGGMFYRSYDPESGELLWQLDMEKGRSSATPVAIGDRIYVGTELRSRGDEDDGGGFLFAIKPGGSGDISPDDDAVSSEFVAWKIAKSDIQMASPAVCNGQLYLLQRQSGNVHCIDAETGETVYRERIRGARAFWASPLTAGGRVYCLDASGTTHVLAGGSEYQLLSSNEIDEQAWATPAAANGNLFIRTVDHLYCIADDQQ